MWDILLAYLPQQKICAISKRHFDNFSRRAACRAPGFGDVAACLNTRILIWPGVWLPFANDISPFVIGSSRRSTFHLAFKFLVNRFSSSSNNVRIRDCTSSDRNVENPTLPTLLKL
jgi:hypothetical protein